MLSMLLAALLQGSPEANEQVSAVAPALVTTQPEWRRRPTWADIDRAYPRSAKRRGLSGAAIIACRVKKDGLLADCAVAEEHPPREGFGKAAIKVSEAFEMRPQTKNGAPVDGGTVRIPIRFLHPNAR
ncbi:energy transducer TonB [Phenylobacterium kunshanense]|nr:energy transducer TonB [Phenylobacterium kunshanense]